MATVRNPIRAAYWTPRWPSPPRPRTATRSPGRAPLFRSALTVVTPAHISGAASGAGSCAGHETRSLVIAVLRDCRFFGVAGVQDHREESGRGLATRIPGHPVHRFRRLIERIPRL